MMLHIEMREAAGVTVVSLKGRLDLGDASRSLAQQVKQLVSQQKTNILVNVDGLTFIDSCGVGELIASFTTVRKGGGTLKLAGPRDHVLKVLQVVRLPQVVEVYDTEQAALASFA